MCQELKKELERGNHAARKLIKHFVFKLYGNFITISVAENKVTARMGYTASNTLNKRSYNV